MGAGADFDEFVRSRGDDLRRVAYLLAGNRDDAEDLVQSALVRALPRWEQVSAEDPYAYVRTILVNAKRGWWRRDRGRTVTVAEVPEGPSAGDAFSGADTRAELRQALGALTPGQRKVIVLRHFEDLSEAETARVLACSPGTVKSQNARALGRLREALGPTRADYSSDRRNES